MMEIYNYLLFSGLKYVVSGYSGPLNLKNKTTLRNWIKSFTLTAERHLIVIPNRYIDPSKSAQKST